jgi:hypothetical protein
MRKLIVSTLFSALVLTSACKEPDPNKFETHVERIKNADSRSQGFIGLEKLTKTVLDAQDNDDLVDEFATKAIPAFEEVWADAEEQQEKMLELLRAVGRPEGAPVWNMALELDGSAGARKKVMMALDGIKKSKADGSVEKIVELYEEILAKPALDDSDTDAGKVRLMMAETLGTIGDKRAVPVLIKVMEQTTETQPVAVHRAAAKALGRIADPSAVDALLTVTFRVPDAPTTTNIGMRSKQALAAIGEPAVPKVLQMLRGDHEAVQDLAAKNAVPQPVIQQTAAGILGAMGANSAVDELVGFMPTDDCQPEEDKKKKGDEDGETDVAAAAGLRAVIANALGFIGDEKASEALCGCTMSTKNPGDMFPIMESLGRIGGDKAVSCLNEVIKAGEYDTEIVVSDFKYEPRWDAARFAVLAASPSNIGSIKEDAAGRERRLVRPRESRLRGGSAQERRREVRRDDRQVVQGSKPRRTDLHGVAAHAHARARHRVRRLRGRPAGGPRRREGFDGREVSGVGAPCPGDDGCPSSLRCRGRRRRVAPLGGMRTSWGPLPPAERRTSVVGNSA